MELLISENQLKSLIRNTLQTKEMGEQEEPVNPQPEAGTSDKQTGGSGYPAVGKWESGVTRGPANQVGVTKWSDVVGANLKRGKANQLKEQDDWWNKSSYDKGIWDKSTKMIDKMGTSEYQHDVLSVLEFGSLFVGPIGPLLSAGFGLGNAGLYLKEGDTKAAGLFFMFSLLPFVDKIPGFKKISESVFNNLAKKLSSKGGKITLTPLENGVLKSIKANEGVLKSELNNKVKQMAINSLKTTKGLSVNTKKNLNTIAKFGLQSAALLGAGVTYNKTYDYFDKKNKEKDFLNNLLKVRPMKDTTDLTPLDIELANRN
jgi:hypothetical protein